MRDWPTLLAGEPCWDAGVEAVYRETGEPRVDAILQSAEELAAFAAFIEAEGVRSYLEVGAWTGALVSCLHRHFHFDRVAVCDDGYAQRRFGLPFRVPAEAALFQGDSRSAAYREWRAALGPIDLVLIDADHSYRGVKADFEVNRQFPHRFLAFHDITGANRHTAGVGRFWRELEGDKRELCLPNRALGLATSEMGIGIWSAR